MSSAVTSSISRNLRALQRSKALRYHSSTSSAISAHYVEHCVSNREQRNTAPIQPLDQIHDKTMLCKRRFSSGQPPKNYLPHGVDRQSDFFGEAITFVKDIEETLITSVDTPMRTQHVNKIITGECDTTKAVEVFDGMALCIISRGASNLHTGNDGDGPDAKALHSSAMTWSDLIRSAYEWNNHSNYTSPMLAVAAVAPLLAQGGEAYVHRIDKLLQSTQASISLMQIAKHAASFRDTFILASGDIDATPLLTPRERYHLHALSMLIQNKHQYAMGAYLRLLELFPGDLLGLSLALDVAYSLGDGEAARTAATIVSTYWSERDGGTLRLHPSQSGQTLASSLVAVGLSSCSASSRADKAESLVEIALARDSDGAGGTSVWALSNILGSEGRSSEMVSRLAGFDGTQLHQNCGFLNFHTRMSGYAGIALLDRRGAGSERSSLRLYDEGFSHLLEYSGNNALGTENGGEEVALRNMRVPRSVASDVIGSIFSGWFRDSGAKPNGNDPSLQNQFDDDAQSTRQQPRTLEDTLCWVPPSPILLAQATSLLFRLTLVGGVAHSDQRWVDLRAAWKYSMEKESGNINQKPFEFMPLALLASSLLLDPALLHSEKLPEQLEGAMNGLHKMGKLLNLGESNDGKLATGSEWREVSRDLAQARGNYQRWEMPEGIESVTYSPSSFDNNGYNAKPIGWDFDVRQFLEHGLCYAAVQEGGFESLCLARALCSEGTTMRQNCPEVWWRYSVVLDLLGDEVAAENARAASISLGSGEGGSTN